MAEIDFFDRVKMLCKLRKITITSLVEKIFDGGKSTPLEIWNGWRSRRNVPRGDIVKKFADALGVSMEYLVSGENPHPRVDFFDKYSRYDDFLQIFDGLSDADKDLIFSVTKKMAAGSGARRDEKKLLRRPQFEARFK